MSLPSRAPSARLEAIDAALPQTQCTRCGFPDCRAYAEAIDLGKAGTDRCPPGGAEGVARLAALTGLPVVALDPQHGQEGPRRMAVIVEPDCIGCTRCIEACPVDCILGAARQMHTVIESLCTGCELCLPACPVDCIALEDATPGRSGWAAWSPAQAAEARERYEVRQARRDRDRRERAARLESGAMVSGSPAAPSPLKPSPTHPAGSANATVPVAPADARRAAVEAALARARAQRAR